MFLPLFENLRNTGVPVSLREYLGFLEALNTGLPPMILTPFICLGAPSWSRMNATLIAMTAPFRQAFRLEKISTDEVLNAVDIPREWLEKLAEKHLSPEEWPKSNPQVDLIS